MPQAKVLKRTTRNDIFQARGAHEEVAKRTIPSPVHAPNEGSQSKDPKGKFSNETYHAEDIKRKCTREGFHAKVLG